MTKARRRTLLALVAVGATLSTPLPPAAADIVTIVGACTLEIRLTASPPADLSATQTSLWFSGSGECVVNGLRTWGTFNGVAATSPLLGWSCAAGVAMGTASFDTGHPSMSTQNVTVELAVAPATLAVDARLVPVFTGVGAFVQTSPDRTTCLNGAALATTVYTGVFAFEDPYIS